MKAFNYVDLTQSTINGNVNSLPSISNDQGLKSITPPKSTNIALTANDVRLQLFIYLFFFHPTLLVRSGTQKHCNNNAEVCCW